MREDVDGVRAHQGGEAQRIARVIREHEERAAVRHEATVQREPVHHGRHAEFAHAVEDVIAAPFATHGLGALRHGQVGAGQVSGAANQLRQ